jgi:CxxC motif-containing protein
MRKLTCIICPIGCYINVEEDSLSPGNLYVTGNRCPRGKVYALEEIREPKRIVSATCKINGDHGAVSRVPVKTASPCPREKIPSLLEDIYKVKITLPVKTGDVIIAGWHGEGIDVVAARTVS